MAQARICGGCELGFANARGGGCGSGGFKGVAGLAFIGAERGLGVRATPSRRGARSGARTRGGVPARPELGDDGRVPRVRERKRKERPALTGPRDGRREGNGPRKEKGRWAGLGWKKGSGPAGKKLLGCGVKKKKAEMGWAERVGEREKTFHFPKRFKHFQIKFKLKDLNLR